MNVEVEPITCWWRSSTSAVRSGEPFTLTLTCQVVETETTKVVPDQSKLDPSVVQLQPFEVHRRLARRRTCGCRASASSSTSTGCG